MFIDQYEQQVYIDIELDVDEVYDGLDTWEKEQLAERFVSDGIGSNGASLEDMEVDDIYDAMTESQLAHLFNKMLKHGSYSAEHTNLGNLVTALLHSARAQGDNDGA